MSLRTKRKISGQSILEQIFLRRFTGHLQKGSSPTLTAVLLFLLVLPLIACVANRSMPDEQFRAHASQNVSAPMILPVAIFPNQGSVYSLAFSPSGRLLALGGKNAITLWDVIRQKTIKTLASGPHDIVSLAFSPDGEMLAAGSYETINLWHVPSGKHLDTLQQGRSAYVSVLAFSSDGRVLASGGAGSNGEENTLFLWDVWEGTLKSRLNYTTPYADAVLALAFSADGGRLASTSLDRRIRVWNAKKAAPNRKPIQVLLDPASAPRTLAFSPDQQTLAAGTAEGRIIFYDLSTGEVSKRFNMHRGSIFSLAYSRDGAAAISTGADQIYHRWQTATGMTLAKRHLNRKAEGVAMTGDGRHLAIQTDFGTAVFFPGARTGIPPMIAILKPGKEETVYEPMIRLTGKIVDDQGIAEVLIRINDVIWQGGNNGASRDLNIKEKVRTFDREVFLDKTLPLTPGKTTITVTAFNVEGMSRSESFEVTYMPDEGEVWAAVIGISDYRHVANLRYADEDAKAFYDYLIHDNQIPQDHVTLLLNEEATLQRLRDLLGVELKKKAGKTDTVIIYYAGHGAPEPDRSSLDGDGLEKYLLPYDADPSRLFSTALPMNEISKIFNRLSAERVIMLQDTCFSGSSGESGLGGRTIQTAMLRASLSGTFLDRMAKGKGRVIITASEANEVSLERDDLGHGVFTYYLLEGLQKGDLDGDGLITTHEAFRYLSKKVPEATGQSQHPVKKGIETADIILGKVRTE